MYKVINSGYLKKRVHCGEESESETCLWISGHPGFTNNIKIGRIAKPVATIFHFRPVEVHRIFITSEQWKWISTFLFVNSYIYTHVNVVFLPEKGLLSTSSGHENKLTILFQSISHKETTFPEKLSFILLWKTNRLLIYFLELLLFLIQFQMIRNLVVLPAFLVFRLGLQIWDLFSKKRKGSNSHQVITWNPTMVWLCWVIDRIISIALSRWWQLISI